MHKKEFHIIFASNNPHKYKECKKILPNIPLVSMTDMGILSNPIENGKSFLENAHIKALHCYEQCKASNVIPRKAYAILAEDSGICVNVLNGEPGIYSSRYGRKGSNTEFEKDPLYQCKLLQENVNNAIKEHPSQTRNARFVCCAILLISKTEFFISHAHWEGSIITHEPIGNAGFGYDPIFFVPEKKCTSAELTLTEKSNISHRAKALRLIQHAIFDIMKL